MYEARNDCCKRSCLCCAKHVRHVHLRLMPFETCIEQAQVETILSFCLAAMHAETAWSMRGCPHSEPHSEPRTVRQSCNSQESACQQPISDANLATSQSMPLGGAQQAYRSTPLSQFKQQFKQRGLDCIQDSGYSFLADGCLDSPEWSWLAAALHTQRAVALHVTHTTVKAHNTVAVYHRVVG